MLFLSSPHLTLSLVPTSQFLVGLSKFTQITFQNIQDDTLKPVLINLPALHVLLCFSVLDCFRVKCIQMYAYHSVP
ncbi:hypothetical protein C8R43DRAFT_1001488 [Mycena crocata]|nr:hypothetical protein C8R43DRAFT_1001488 [Mycena crocata]